MTIEDIQEVYFKENGYTIVSDSLAHNLGNDSAIVYTKLVGAYLYFKKEGKLTDNFFFCSIDFLEYKCNVSQYQQKKILDGLSSRGLIEVKYKGLPRRRYVSVLCNEQAVKKAFEFVPMPDKDAVPMPDGLKDMYSVPFSFDILCKQIEKASVSLGLSKETAEGTQRLYRQYIDFFGEPKEFYSQKSIESVMARADSLDNEFYIFDESNFTLLLEAYEEVNTFGYTRSINNMLTYEMLDVLQKRII